MQSFKLKKTSGNEDVTHEALIWLIVLVVVVLPLLYVVYLYAG